MDKTLNLKCIIVDHNTFFSNQIRKFVEIGLNNFCNTLKILDCFNRKKNNVERIKLSKEIYSFNKSYQSMCVIINAELKTENNIYHSNFKGAVLASEILHSMCIPFHGKIILYGFSPLYIVENILHSYYIDYSINQSKNKLAYIQLPFSQDTFVTKVIHMMEVE